MVVFVYWKLKRLFFSFCVTALKICLTYKKIISNFQVRATEQTVTKKNMNFLTFTWVWGRVGNSREAPNNKLLIISWSCPEQRHWHLVSRLMVGRPQVAGKLGESWNAIICPFSLEKVRMAAANITIVQQAWGVLCIFITLLSFPLCLSFYLYFIHWGHIPILRPDQIYFHAVFLLIK